MDRDNDLRLPVVIAVAALAVIVSVAAMFWIWRTGGLPFGAKLARDAALEECAARVSGSSQMGLELAPAIVGDFLRQSGYEVGAPQTLPDGLIRIEGRRGQVRCTVTVRALENTTGFDDLAAGEAVVALSSRPILPRDIAALTRAKAGDFTAERALAEHVVAYDALAVIVHRSNQVERMTTDVVGDLAIGRIENWRRVGGSNSPINIYSTLEQAGADDYPNDLVPSNADVWVNAQERPSSHVLRDDPAVIAALARDRSGIGFVSASFLREAANVRALRIGGGGVYAPPTLSAMHAQTYALTRRFFVYVRPRDMRENAFVRGFVTYFKSPAAYDRIDELGFAALRENAAADANAIRAMGCVIGAPETATLALALRGAQKSDVVLRFRPNTSRLDNAAEADVGRLASELIDRITHGWHVILVGHSDPQGELEENRNLALERALAARAAFEARGVFGLQVESAGENCTIADMETKEGQRLNRRVEIWMRPSAQTRAAGP